MLESEEAARRLGVKVNTLYAYVSRGLLVSRPAPSGRRRSLFDVDEVERLARRSRGGKAVETRMATITTGITQLTDDGPIYRGRPAVELATTATFEEAATWLWRAEGEVPPWVPLDVGPPPPIGPSDRIRWAVVMAGALDRLRADLRPESVLRRAAQLAATMVDVLPVPEGGPTASEHGGAREQTTSMADRLASKLLPAPDESMVRWVNAALVLMADHELATSTLAVRVAASTRADLYDAVLAGLGTIAGPLHGGASQQAYGLLVDAERHGVERAVDETLRWQGVLPGFGHSVYKRGDARFDLLLELLEPLMTPTRCAMVSSMVQLTGDHDIPPPNVDLALAAAAWATGMPPEFGRTLFTVARVAGWTAHYLEELEERPLRYRARAVYSATANATAPSSARRPTGVQGPDHAAGP
jgi:citrate synthase